MYDFLLVVHIIAGMVCLVIGLCAAFSQKRRGKHTRFGEIYHGSYVFVFVTAALMAMMRWEQLAYLFYIALFSYALALSAYLAVKIRWKNWIGLHIGGMLGSYIGVVTAVLVVNVSSISIFNGMPALLFWFLPTIVGTPIIFGVRKRFDAKHPSWK